MGGSGGFILLLHPQPPLLLHRKNTSTHSRALVPGFVSKELLLLLPLLSSPDPQETYFDQADDWLAYVLNWIQPLFSFFQPAFFLFSSFAFAVCSAKLSFRHVEASSFCSPLKEQAREAPPRERPKGEGTRDTHLYNTSGTMAVGLSCHVALACLNPHPRRALSQQRKNNNNVSRGNGRASSRHAVTPAGGVAPSTQEQKTDLAYFGDTYVTSITAKVLSVEVREREPVCRFLGERPL